MIDWTKPIRVKFTGEPARLLALHRDQAFITWGIRELSAVEVSAQTGKWKDADIFVENVPGEGPSVSDDCRKFWEATEGFLLPIINAGGDSSDIIDFLFGHLLIQVKDLQRQYVLATWRGRPADAIDPRPIAAKLIEQIQAATPHPSSVPVPPQFRRGVKLREGR